MITAGTQYVKKEKATRMGVRALLRVHIIQMVNQYMKLKELPLYERENLDMLYHEYVNLGGNGAISSLVTRVMELPPTTN